MGTSTFRIAAIVGTNIAIIAVWFDITGAACAFCAAIGQGAGISVFARKGIVGVSAACGWIAAIVCTGIVVITRQGRGRLAATIFAAIARGAGVAVIASFFVGGKYAVACLARLISAGVSVVAGDGRVARALAVLTGVVDGAGISVATGSLGVAVVASASRQARV